MCGEDGTGLYAPPPPPLRLRADAYGNDHRFLCKMFIYIYNTKVYILLNWQLGPGGTRLPRHMSPPGPTIGGGGGVPYMPVTPAAVFLRRDIKNILSEKVSGI